MRFLTEEFLHHLLNLRHARLTADQHDFVNLVSLHTGIGHRLAAGLERSLENVVDQLLQFGASQLADQVLWSVRIRGNEGQVDLCLHCRRELDLGCFGGLFQTLQSHFVALRPQVQALFLLELIDQPVDDPLVDVVAAQVGIAVGGLDLDNAFTNLEDRDIEGATAEVVDRDGLVLLLVEAVGERCRRGLVDDALHVQTGDAAGVLGRLALRVIEVRGHGDDGLGHRRAEIALRRLFQLLQDHRRDLRRGVLLTLRHNDDMVALRLDGIGNHLHLVRDFVGAAAHEALDRVDGVLGVRHRLPLCRLPHQPLAGLGKGHNGRSGTVTLAVGDDLGLAAFHNGHHGIGGAQIDANNLCHSSPDLVARAVLRSLFALE